ncbi:hypothetical protein [Priestia aryabhattai]
MKFISGGYYIVTPEERVDYMDKNVIPQTILSLSECICDFHPEINVIWGGSTDKKNKYIQRLDISRNTYERLEKWIDEKFDAGAFAYPQVFTSVEVAREFADKFLSGISNVHIIGIGLPEAHLRDFYEYENLEGPKEEQNGVEKLITSGSMVEQKKSRFLGYEVLGYESGGFHSYLCNGLEKDFNQHFHFSLNNNGFIDSLEEANRYCKYSNQQEIGTEPVNWFPWAVFEYENILMH